MKQQKPFAVDRRSFIGATLAGLTAAATSPAMSGILQEDILGCFDATELGRMVNSGAVTALELVDAAIRRIEVLDPHMNALSACGFEQARRRAATYVPDGASFAGVPFLLKDVLEYPGLPHESGSRMFRGNVPDWKSDYVARTEAAGLHVLGKTTTPEFGLLPSTEPVLTGPTANPWNQTLSPGGSSGGSCAAVASGMVPFAHASDGGGSIRIPASLCGLFGFKPSRGRQTASRRTRLPADISVDHCVSWSVRDSARLLALTEQQGSDPVGFVSGASAKRLRIGFILPNLLGRNPDAEVERAIRNTAMLCEDLGHSVDEARWPFDGQVFVDHFMTVWSAGAAGIAQLYQKRTGEAPDDSVLEPWTLALAKEFAAKDPSELASALSYFDRLTNDALDWHTSFDVYLSPVTTAPMLRTGELSPTAPVEAMREGVIGFASYTPVQNVIGSPAMSVPLAQSSRGTPIGSHFSARAGDDATLLALAYELEGAAPWASRRPGVAL